MDNGECVYDERLARRLKRRRIDVGGFEINACKRSKRKLEDEKMDVGFVDKDYKKFLNTGGLDSSASEDEDEDDDDDDDDDDDYNIEDGDEDGDGDDKYSDDKDGDDSGEDDIDPQYKMFLENLREEGKSYVLEVNIKNERVLIMYEEEDESKERLGRSAGEEVPKRERIEAEKETPEKGIVDECYQTFLKGLKQEGDYLVWEADGMQVKYEADTGSSSDSEILATDSAPPTYTCVTSRMFDTSISEDNWQCLGIHPENYQTQFRERVMELLRRPYDQNEYEELLQKIGHRDFIEGQKNLRKRIVTFKGNKSGKSYLDHHKDLRKQMHAAQFDRRKVLNLLRGFFYWLQNLSHSGAFKPWADKACLGMLPANH